MDIIFKECRTKERKIILHKERIFHDIDALTYKASEVAAEPLAKDAMASDSEDNYDGAIMARLVNMRALNLKKRLSFCLRKEHAYIADNNIDNSGAIEYDFVLPSSFDDINLEVAAELMHEYIVRGALVDWYDTLGTANGQYKAAELIPLESKILDIFRVPGFVRHPALPYQKSYKIR